MKNISSILVLIISILTVFTACQQREKVDWIIYGSKIYTMDKNNTVAQAMAISRHKIIDIGDTRYILSKYTSDSMVDLKNKFIYPAFIDAHAHFFGLAYSLGECNLYGATSVKEIINRLKEFQQENPTRQWLIGRGWDQNLFPEKIFPTKTTLDSVFKNIPICLTRVDGHAIWVNSKALEIAQITATTVVSGGEILVDKHHQPTGILIDNATHLVEKHIPPLSRKEIISLLLKAQELCWKNNLHCIHDAGLDLWQIYLLDSLQHAGLIKMRIYAMASLNRENLDYFLKNGWIDKDLLKVKAFKIYVDGALGSRGALLKKKYADIHPSNTKGTKQSDHGLLLIDKDTLSKILALLYEKNFQACTHAIGDSANKLILQLYAQYLTPSNDRRWRIEHVQVVDTSELWYFKKYNIIPSVQPTHAISDKKWAIDRLGKERISFAYAYQSLWQQNKILALGTDFPVENVSPLKTFFAAVFRCDYDLRDTTRFQPKDALTRFQALRGMTIDAAYAGFMDNELGSLEKGKYADFVVLDIDLMKIQRNELSKILLSQH